MRESEEPVFVDQDDTSLKLNDAMFILRVHLSETLNLQNIAEYLKV